MKRHAALLTACLLLPGPAPAGGADIVIDTAGSQVGFTLRTRWAQTLEGRFPAHAGEVLALAGGERQVRLVLDAAQVEIVGHPRYTRLTRGEGFFDASRFPRVEFVSEPFPASLLAEGGDLAGVLNIRGVGRRELFTLAPATCAQPLLDCPVMVEGDVSRSDYAMDRWGMAMSDRVQFHLALRGSAKHGR